MYRQLLHMVSRGNLHVTATLGPIGFIDHHEHHDLHKHCDHHNHHHHDHHNYNLHKHNYNHHDYNPTFSSVGSGMSILIFLGLTHMTPFIQILGDGACGIYPSGCLVWQWFTDLQWILQMSSFINYLTMLLPGRGAVPTAGI